MVPRSAPRGNGILRSRRRERAWLAWPNALRSRFEQGRIPMSDSILQVGQTVPDFTLTTYEPTTKGFGTFKLGEAMKNGKWTLLFFYPADYTFV
jgi:hypothetical protein